MSGQVGGAAAPEPSAQAGGEPGAGDAIDRIWGTTGPTGLLVAVFAAAAFVFGGTVYAVTAYGPTETEPATVVRQYSSSTGGTRSICGIEVQVASGEKGKGAGGNVCSVYDEGDQAVALVSTITGDVVGVRHAGRDLGRSGNTGVGLIPIFALGTVVSTFIAARRKGQPGVPKMAGAAVAGGLIGLAVYWLLF